MGTRIMASTSRTAAWDGTMVRLCLGSLLNPVESVGATDTSSSASATLGVLRRLQVPNFEALLFLLLLLSHFWRSFLVSFIYLDGVGIIICAKATCASRGGTPGLISSPVRFLFSPPIADMRHNRFRTPSQRSHGWASFDATCGF
jgi:hypothetical protein